METGCLLRVLGFGACVPRAMACVGAAAPGCVPCWLLPFVWRASLVLAPFGHTPIPSAVTGSRRVRAVGQRSTEPIAFADIGFVGGPEDSKTPGKRTWGGAVGGGEVVRDPVPRIATPTPPAGPR